jgi:plastocyanin
MNRKKWLALIALGSFVLVLALAGCSKKEEAPSETPAPAAAPTAKATPIDAATVATVTGTIKLDGAAPKPKKIDMSQDPACSGGMGMTETVVSEGGKLANVFVYVKEGLGDRTFTAPAESASIDQHGCHYVPHVLGVMAGQTVKILNSDPTTHNIHPSPKNNKEWNESQAPKSAALEKSFAREEVLLPVKCNQHPWMKMYIGVVKSPFFAVSGKDGSFTIKGLPPGKYTIAAVHETLGEQTMQIEVGAKESKTADFSFKAAQ